LPRSRQRTLPSVVGVQVAPVLSRDSLVMAYSRRRCLEPELPRASGQPWWWRSGRRSSSGTSVLGRGKASRRIAEHPSGPICPLGLLPPLDPSGAAPAGHRLYLPAEVRPDRPASREGLPRRPASGLRPRAVRRPQRRRAVLQPAQTVPRPGHPLRQASRLLPSRDHHRGHRVVAAHGVTGHALGRR